MYRISITEFPIPDEEQTSLLLAMGIDPERYNIPQVLDDGFYLMHYGTRNEIILKQTQRVHPVAVSDLNAEQRELLLVMDIQPDHYSVIREFADGIRLKHGSTGNEIRIGVNRRTKRDCRG